MIRAKFREVVFERDNHKCVVPSCSADAVDAHHLLERSLWENGGYLKDNGASVCEEHHKLAEQNIIPPAALYRWCDIEDPPLPKDIDSFNVNKWGDPFECPRWQEYRDYIKYPSTRHLPFSHERDADDTAHDKVTQFVDIPLVITMKMDGGNAMIVKDTDNPVRARNGRHADKDHFDMAKQWYWENNLYEQIPEHLQIFGEWLYAKHSIHYGCDCDTECEDAGPALRDYFQVFGMFDTRYNLWLGWEETKRIADSIDLTLVPASPIGYEPSQQFDNRGEAYNMLYDISRRAVEQGHEGIVVRSKHPFHYGQIDERLGKYVRPGHVKEGEKHWSKRPLVQNQLRQS
jgi:hypothetical protein